VTEAVDSNVDGFIAKSHLHMLASLFLDRDKCKCLPESHTIIPDKILSTL